MSPTIPPLLYLANTSRSFCDHLSESLFRRQVLSTEPPSQIIVPSNVRLAQVTPLATREGRLTVKKFAAVPALLDQPAIERPSPTVSNVSSFRGPGDRVDLAEGCLVTKTVKYTHQLAHWVNPVRNGDPTEIEGIIEGLRIVPVEGFEIDSLCNLSYRKYALVDPDIHIALDLYAFVAVTGSATSLDALIQLVLFDNNRRQDEIDRFGAATPRQLDLLSNSTFLDPEYELVVLHPGHFLPNGSSFASYDRETQITKSYVVASDNRLRESRDPQSPRFPSFHSSFPGRNTRTSLDIFLVILNADIKFRRYFEMVGTAPLPNDVLALMKRTMELVELLYWTPAPSKLSEQDRYMEGIASDETEEMQDVRQDVRQLSLSRYKRMRWFRDADLNTRMAYGRAVMSGHDRDYDPTLFEDAYPVNYEHPKKDISA